MYGQRNMAMAGSAFAVGDIFTGGWAVFAAITVVFVLVALWQLVRIRPASVPRP